MFEALIEAGDCVNNAKNRKENCMQTYLDTIEIPDEKIVRLFLDAGLLTDTLNEIEIAQIKQVCPDFEV